MEETYVFNDVNDFVAYLKVKLTAPTPLKLYSSLYLIYSFYLASYGSIDYSKLNEFQLMKHFPKRLFPAKFVGKTYGAISENVDLETNAKDTFVNNTPEAHNIKLFIDDLISQINEVNDFGLVDRVHKDKAWFNAYNNKTYVKDEDILNDYCDQVG